jgi:hypothetical protein
LWIRARYRKAIHEAQNLDLVNQKEAMYESMATKDTNRFWASWKKVHNKDSAKSSPVISGATDDSEIVEIFKNAFQQNSVTNN